MQITQIVLNNFRNYTEATLDFSRYTAIRGANGIGKSSIAEAVVWCLFGLDITGKAKADDRLMRIGASDMSVVTSFVTDVGQPVVFTRMKQQGKGAVLTINGKKAKPGDIERFFGEANEFLSVFAPGYFSSLEPKDARAVMAKCLPIVEKEEVMDKLGDGEREIIARHKLADGIESVDFLASKLRTEIKEFEEQVLRFDGRVEVFEEQIARGKPAAPESEITEEARQQYARAKEQVAAIVSQHNNRESVLSALLQKQSGFRPKYEKLAKRLVQDVDTKCHTCGQDLPADKVEVIRSMVDAQNAELQADIKALIEEGNQVKAEIEHLNALPETPEVDINIQSQIERFEQLERDELQIQSEYRAQCKMFDDAVANLEQAKADQKRERALLAQAKDELKAVLEYRNRYVQVQHEKLNHLFTNVKIRLIEGNADGELKHVFKIEWKNLPYRVLSTSQKARCDIEIGRVIAAVRGETLPVFVDCAESIQNLFNETFSGQAIAAYVSEGDFSVEVLDGQSVVGL